MSGAPSAIPSDSGHVCTVVGLGLRAHAQPAALHALWMQARGLLQDQAALSLPASPPCAVAVLDTKAEHPALATWLSAIAGNARAVPVLPVPADRMAGQSVATQSPRLQARYGTGSVAEAAALWAAGPLAELAVQRLVAADGSATLAVAIRRAGHPACCVAARPFQELQGAPA